MSCRVLVVDDHEDTLTMMLRLLKVAGYQVHGALSCSAAMQVVDALGGQIDLLICDIGLPDGDGMDLMTRLKQRCGCKVAAVTGFGSPSDAHGHAEQGVDRVLVKPISLDSLKGLVEELCPAPAQISKI